MPNRTIYHATLTPGDTYFNRLWGLHNIHQNVNGTIGTDDADIDATEALDIITGSTGSNTVVIAVIDSGVKWDHEDLVGNIWSNPGEALNGGDTEAWQERLFAWEKQPGQYMLSSSDKPAWLGKEHLLFNQNIVKVIDYKDSEIFASYDNSTRLLATVRNNTNAQIINF